MVRHETNNSADHPHKAQKSVAAKSSWSNWLPSFVPLLTKKTKELMNSIEKAVFVTPAEDELIDSLKCQVHALQQQVTTISSSQASTTVSNNFTNSASIPPPPAAASSTSPQSDSSNIVKRGLALLEMCEIMEKDEFLNPLFKERAPIAINPVTYSESKEESSSSSSIYSQTLPYAYSTTKVSLWQNFRFLEHLPYVNCSSYYRLKLQFAA
jgi:hypothetical protein